MHRGNRAVFLHAGLNLHQYRMAAAMTVENFFTCKRALDRAAGYHGQLAHDHFVIERIALAAKATTVRGRDDANVTRRYFQHLG